MADGIQINKELGDKPKEKRLQEDAAYQKLKAAMRE